MLERFDGGGGSDLMGYGQFLAHKIIWKRVLEI